MDSLKEMAQCREDWQHCSVKSEEWSECLAHHNCYLLKLTVNPLLQRWLLHICMFRDHYITMVQWRDNSHVLVAWSNRAQNHTVLTLCNAYSTDCQLVRQIRLSTCFCTTTISLYICFYSSSDCCKVSEYISANRQPKFNEASVILCFKNLPLCNRQSLCQSLSNFHSEFTARKGYESHYKIVQRDGSYWCVNLQHRSLVTLFDSERILTRSLVVADKPLDAYSCRAVLSRAALWWMIAIY